MIKTILVASSGTEADAATYAAALAIARPFGAHIDVLHVRLDPATIAVAMAGDAAGTGVLTAGLIDRLDDDARAREATARAIFTRFCQEAGLAIADAPAPGAATAAPSAGFHVEIGDEARWMAVYGLTADLIVAPRGADDQAIARATLEAALLGAGRPILIPAGAAPAAGFARIAIGWKPTREAARAVALAMPFLSRAKEVVVLSVDEPDAEPATAEAGRLVRSLAWHGINARAERLTAGPAEAAATLLAAAAGRADLLVIGGYGHTRLREWVFGGFTQQALDAAALPVLLAH